MVHKWFVLSLSISETSQAETSQYTALLSSFDELCESTASQFLQSVRSQIVIDDVQNISHVSDSQLSSGECFMLSMYTIASLKVIIQSVYFYSC